MSDDTPKTPPRKSGPPNVPKSRPKSKPAKKAKSKNTGAVPIKTTSTASGGFIWLVVFAMVIGAGGWWLWPQIGPELKPLIAKVRGVSQPVDLPTKTGARAPGKQETRAPVLPQFDPQPAPAVEPAGAASHQMQAQIDAMGQRLSAITSALATGSSDAGGGGSAEMAAALADINNALANISARLDALEARPQISRDPTASAQALVLATTQLRSRLIGEGPFTTELDLLQGVAGDSVEVEKAIGHLKPHAQAGVLTVQTLAAQFKNLGREVLKARVRDQQTGWMGEVKTTLSSLITIRRTDPSKTTDPLERALAEAGVALEVGALDEAVAALMNIEGAPGAVLAAWMGDAQARLLAESAMEALHNHALTRLAGTGLQ